MAVQDWHRGSFRSPQALFSAEISVIIPARFITTNKQSRMRIDNREWSLSAVPAHTFASMCNIESIQSIFRFWMLLLWRNFMMSDIKSVILNCCKWYGWAKAQGPGTIHLAPNYSPSPPQWHATMLVFLPQLDEKMYWLPHHLITWSKEYAHTSPFITSRELRRLTSLSFSYVIVYTLSIMSQCYTLPSLLSRLEARWHCHRKSVLTLNNIQDPAVHMQSGTFAHVGGRKTKGRSDL